MTLIFRVAALILLLVIMFVTLSPIRMRPQWGNPTFERFMAYFLLGAALSLGFPNRLVQITLLVVLVAAILELLQAIDPSRHARFSDASVKALAGVMGTAVGQLFVDALTSS